MSDENQTRSSRNKKDNKDSKWFKRSSKSSRNNNSTFDKIFYILIALLFLLLVAFIIFIMNFSGDNTANVSEDLIQTEGRDSIRELFSEDGEQTEESEEDTDTAEQSADSEDDSANTDEGSSEETDDQTDEDSEEEDTEDEESSDGDSSVINENPPHDPSYAVDYADGSADRIEIRENVLAATGIEAGNLTENWIGNDGPGRVEATVTDRETGQQYVVYLSYGEGQWHVESVNPQ